MNKEKNEEIESVEELPDDWWYRVYLAVMVMTVVVLTSLWAFSRYFSG